MSIEVKNLRYVYNPGMPGETLALDDVSFEVRDGEVLGVIGHTGSGKSTLLQHLNGLLHPESGEVYVDGQCITDGSVRLVEVRRKVGLVFQYPEYQLFEETVAKDVAFGPRNLGLSDEEIEARCKDAISIVGLDYEELKDVSPFELSGGQKRRVAIAGVVAMNPSVLILDEPTAGLDPKAHRDVLAMINRIHEQRGIIIILVTHNMDDIANMTDRVLVMNQGKIVLSGTPREVYSHRNELAEMGLGVPPATEIMAHLGEAIPGISSNAMTIDEAAEDIRRYLSASDVFSAE